MSRKKKRSGTSQNRTTKSAAASGGKKGATDLKAGGKGGIVGVLRAAAGKIKKALGRKSAEPEAKSSRAGSAGKSSKSKGDGKAVEPSGTASASARTSKPQGRTEPYIPKQQSMHSSPMGSGKGRDRDEEAIAAEADRNEEFNDEDRLTNKSGDPRIGTHGRTYDS
ncbi:MAG TPA: hypothetical protein VNM92_03315 [Thermoanaerobaculia bacterium]|nr:hypothetical protein [Thermoanaerobaculia bacterium]